MAPMADRKANPLKEFRLRAGLTLDEASKQIGVSRQLLIRAEHGAYNKPPPSVVNYYVKRFPETSLVLLFNDYSEFQKTSRVDSYGILVDPFPVSDYYSLFRASPKNTPHPFTFWRMIPTQRSPHGTTLNTVSNMFCVNQSALHKFEKTPHLQHVVPEQLTSALEESGYFINGLVDLDMAYKSFRAFNALKVRY